MNFSQMRTLKYLLLFILLFNISCKKTETSKVQSNKKEITFFDIKKEDGSQFNTGEINISFSGDSIKVLIPFGVNRNMLIPVITFNGKQIIPASGVAQNFTNPITYTVYAEDGSTRSYVVSVQNEAQAIQSKTVYFGDEDGNFYALDALTGIQIWRHTFPSASNLTYGAPAYYDGNIFTASSNGGDIFCLNALNGNLVWQYHASNTGIESSPTVMNGVVYFGTNDDEIIALDANNGNLIWRYMTGGNVSTGPIISNGNLYIGSSDTRLYSLDISSGQQIWNSPMSGLINQSGPVFSNSNLYVGSRYGYLTSVNSNNGSINWRFSTDTISLEMSSPTVANGIVYIAGWYNFFDFSIKGSVYAVNASNGQLIWESLQNTGFSCSPIVESNLLFIVGDDSKLYALNATTGSIVWQVSHILHNGSSPCVANGIVYMGSGGSHYFLAFDAQTGNQIWQYNVPTSSKFSPPLVVFNGTQTQLYYSTVSGMKQ
jgi:outer membrane protein assembly factor BamB